MKQMRSFIVLLLSATMLAQCSKHKQQTDTEYPAIDTSIDGAFPVQCSEVQRGQKLVFKANFSDNVELGSYSLDIHHNFDHHNHSTEVASCDMEPLKTGVKPFVFIKSFDIPAGLRTYTPSLEIVIPADVDGGDYHFLIRLVDKEGWPTIKGLSIKIK